MLKFEKIRLINFLSYKDLTFNLDLPGLNGFVGINGAGKSNIWDGVCWVLFGKPIRSRTLDEGAVAVTDIIRADQKICKGTIQLHDGAIEIEIVRTRSASSGSLKLKVNGHKKTKTTSAATQQEIDRVIGFDYKTFLQVIIFGQGIVKTFIYATDVERKLVFERILNLEEIREACKRAGKKVKDIDDAHFQTEQDIKQLRTTAVVLKDDLQQLVEKSALFSTTIDTQLKTAQRSINQRSADLQKFPIIDVVKIRSLLQGAIGASRSADINLKTKRSEFAQVLVCLRTQRDAAYGKLASARGNTNTLIQKIQQTARGDLLGQTCNVCGTAITQVTVVHFVKDIQKELIVQTQKSAVLDSAFKTADALLTHSVAVFQSVLDKLSAEVESIENTIGVYNTQLDDHMRDIQRQEQLKNEILQLTEQCAVIVAQENSFRPLIVSKQEKDSELQKAIASAETELKGLLEERKYYQFWVEGYGNRGIKSHILDSIVPFLNERAQYYSLLLTQGEYTITFNTQKLIGDNLKDTFDVQAVICNGAQDFSLFSGGEKQRTNIIIAMTLQDLVASRACKAVNLKIFDEPFTGLDAVGRDFLLELMQKAAKDHTVFFVTHDVEYQGRFTRLFKVKKQNGFSTIKEDRNGK